jgi:uncharacterized membrane protein YeiH
VNPLYFLDLFGTFVFALSGAFRAIKYELDILGLLVLSVFTGVGGGILRDLILGHSPPSAFIDEYYLIISLAAGLLAFFLAPVIARGWSLVKLADALGLAVFAVIGAAKGVEADIGPIGVTFIGALTATGGGVIRDLMVREIPLVIRADFYATAAVGGSLLFWALSNGPLAQEWNLLIAGVFVLILRVLAMKFKIQLPRAKHLPATPMEIAQGFQKEEKSKKNSKS